MLGRLSSRVHVDGHGSPMTGGGGGSGPARAYLTRRNGPPVRPGWRPTADLENWRFGCVP